MNTNDKLLSSQEAANFLGITLGYLYKLRCKGSIPCYKPFGKKCYYSERELTKAIKSRPAVAK